MENQNPTGEQDLSKLKSMFADFQKKQSQSNTKKSGKDLLAKYFVPRKSKETFRILTPKKGRKHIEEAFFHVVVTTIAGGKKKHNTVIYCPAHNDPKVPKLDAEGKPLVDTNGTPLMVHAPCPLCAKHKTLIAKQDPSLKGIKKENMNDMQLNVKAKNDEIWNEARKWQPKKYYIVRGIDKGLEKDGVKFWRFKHNYRNQGTLDKLLPILEDYMTNQQADFSDSNNGTDLNIIMTDSEFNGHVYKAISAITAKGKSKLHPDPQVVEAWLNDDITWRDVYLPKKAPNTTPYEFLEMVSKGQNPYWEDTDQTNKHWVFPGRPDLEEKANTRTMNLDNKEENFEQASDLNTLTQPQVTIDNVTEQNVGTYSDDATDLGKETLTKTENNNVDDSEDTHDKADGDVSDYDDLPF
ncbi:MAG: hypothetical protein PF487_00245 [Bacteroidales bacterium]|jgi:glutaredoxin|nr:hypothetical protein [Bacteroidales bacterium]